MTSPCRYFRNRYTSLTRSIIASTESLALPGFRLLALICIEVVLRSRQTPLPFSVGQLIAMITFTHPN